ncbi:MAG TPA: peroxidase family protein, partial [Gammaproteobacteria bacterium]
MDHKHKTHEIVRNHDDHFPHDLSGKKQKHRRDRRPPRYSEFRSIDGGNNNLKHPGYGMPESRLRRVLPAAYADGVYALAGPNRPNPRLISNRVMAQSQSFPNSRNASSFVWQWGQFLDHDIDLTEGTVIEEPAHVPMPVGDPIFDPDGTGSAYMLFNRSAYDHATGTGVDNPRQQINQITAWIDGSQVYGSDEVRAAALRANDGTGRLATSAGNLLPFNTAGLPNAGGPSSDLFLAGDVRVNEQLGLTAMHALFVREHNRIAMQLYQRGRYTEEEIYQRARRKVIALLQAITYNEFIPALLGWRALSPYRGYNPAVDPQIANSFATAAFRLGHSMLNPFLLRLDENGNEIEHGHLTLQEAFFTPETLIDEGGIEPLLRGLAAQKAETIDIYVIDDVRNFLFGPGTGLDLVSLNIQRGRDHGLPDYNTARIHNGLPPAESFADITSDPVAQQRLQQVYGTVDDIDLWVGIIAEDHRRGALIGELGYRILKRQFEALRDGDRLWYERIFRGRELAEIQHTRLADVIHRNTTIG